MLKRILLVILLIIITGCGRGSNKASSIDVSSTTTISVNSSFNNNSSIASVTSNLPVDENTKLITFDSISNTSSSYDTLEYQEDGLDLTLVAALVVNPGSTNDYVDLSTGGDKPKAIRFRVDNQVSIQINNALTNVKEISFKACRFGVSNTYRDYDAITNFTLLESTSIDGEYQAISSFTLNYTVDNPGVVSFAINATSKTRYYQIKSTTESISTTRFLVDTLQIKF